MKKLLHLCWIALAFLMVAQPAYAKRVSSQVSNDNQCYLAYAPNGWKSSNPRDGGLNGAIGSVILDCADYDTNKYRGTATRTYWCDGPGEVLSPYPYGSCSVPCPTAGTPAGTQIIIGNWATGPNANSPMAYPPSSHPANSTYCSGTCTVTGAASSEPNCAIGQIPNALGYFPVSCQVAMINGGQACTPSAATPEPSAANVPSPAVANPGTNKCPSGTINGGIDSAGIPICIGNPKPPTTPPPVTTKPPVTTTNPDGSTVKTEQTVTQNADGSTTTKTTTTTTAADGTKTVTVGESTSSTPGGAPGTPDKPPEQKDLCEKYPNLTICQNSTVAGACSTVTCNGDAIQCALLRTQSERNCRDKATEDEIKGSPLYAKGNAVTSGNDPDAAGLPRKDNATSVAVPSFDASGWLGAGSCFPDKTFQIQGRSITLPISQACQYLIVLRYALMVIASLIAFRMFSGTILRD